jgi:hypothetical protein
MNFIFFSWKCFKKSSQIQNFRILEPLIVFKFNSKICNFMTKNFEKALSSYKFSWERAFSKFLVIKLQILELNLKSMSGSKILKFWIWDDFLKHFQGIKSIHLWGGKSPINNVSKTLCCIKIYPRKPEISSIECRKTCEIDWNPYCFFIQFHAFFDVKL